MKQKRIPIAKRLEIYKKIRQQILVLQIQEQRVNYCRILDRELSDERVRLSKLTELMALKPKKCWIYNSAFWFDPLDGPSRTKLINQAISNTKIRWYHKLFNL